MYITRKHVISQFAKYMPGDNVILIKSVNGSTPMPPPIYCTVTGIRFVNKKAAKRIPKFRVQDLSRLEADPDLLMYQVLDHDSGLSFKVFEHALILYNETNAYLEKRDCDNIYRSKHRQFRHTLDKRRKKRLIKSTAAASVAFAISVWLAVMTFSMNTILCDVLLSLAYLIGIAAVFAVSNRNVERIRLK